MSILDNMTTDNTLFIIGTTYDDRAKNYKFLYKHLF